MIPTLLSLVEEFRARAWTAANNKARELGWIVSSCRKPDPCCRVGSVYGASKNTCSAPTKIQTHLAGLVMLALQKDISLGVSFAIPAIG
jgi:hypothetical protein